VDKKKLIRQKKIPFSFYVFVVLESKTREVCKALQQPMLVNGIMSSDFGMDWFINDESMTFVDGKYSINSFIFFNILMSLCLESGNLILSF